MECLYETCAAVEIIHSRSLALSPYTDEPSHEVFQGATNLYFCYGFCFLLFYIFLDKQMSDMLIYLLVGNVNTVCVMHSKTEFIHKIINL